MFSDINMKIKKKNKLSHHSDNIKFKKISLILESL